MSWDWNWTTILLVMGGIAFIEVYHLHKVINRHADEIDRLKYILKRKYGIDIDGYDPENEQIEL